MDEQSLCLQFDFKAILFLFGLIFFGYDSVKATDTATRSIRSHDGDIIDCVNIYKQPAFDHPALQNHNLQMAPSLEPTREEMKQNSPRNTISQIWRLTGKCPEETIPIRRDRNQRNSQSKLGESYHRKAPAIPRSVTELNQTGTLQLLQQNRSKAILLTYGYRYTGAKGDIRVWNPKVESGDEYTTSQVSLQSGPYYEFDTVEAGWMVNPSLYGDNKTRLFVYWTADGSNKTGCFDLTCPGFIQTSSEIALGAAIYPISVPNRLPYEITLYIFQDPKTGNWWVQYGEKTNIGYWPRTLFKSLYYHAESAEWGGEVYSTKLGRPPHTATEMGNGKFPDYIFDNSGSVKRIRIRDNSLVLKQPGWAYNHVDEYRCYNAEYIDDYVEDPEFYYGGPGKNVLCP